MYILKDIFDELFIEDKAIYLLKKFVPCNDKFTIRIISESFIDPPKMLFEFLVEQEKKNYTES